MYRIPRENNIWRYIRRVVRNSRMNRNSWLFNARLLNFKARPGCSVLTKIHLFVRGQLCLIHAYLPPLCFHLLPSRVHSFHKKEKRKKNSIPSVYDSTQCSSMIVRERRWFARPLTLMGPNKGCTRMRTFGLPPLSFHRGETAACIMPESGSLLYRDKRSVKRAKRDKTVCVQRFTRAL